MQCWYLKQEPLKFYVRPNLDDMVTNVALISPLTEVNLVLNDRSLQVTGK